MDLLLFLFLSQLFYLMIKFGPMQGMFSSTIAFKAKRLTKKQVKTYLIPVVGIYFIFKDFKEDLKNWYKKLED